MGSLGPPKPKTLVMMGLREMFERMYTKIIEQSVMSVPSRPLWVIP
jgi:hypothetical protein